MIMRSTYPALAYSMSRCLFRTSPSTTWFLTHLSKIGKRYGGINRTKVQNYATRPQSVLASVEQKVIPVFRHAEKYVDRIALRDRHGDYTYQGIFLSSNQLASMISASLGNKRQERVAFLCQNDASYVIAQWACWMSGQIAVPLFKEHPPKLLKYYIQDSQAKLLIAAPEFADDLASVASELDRELIVLDDTLRVLAMKPVVKPGTVILQEGEEEASSSVQHLEGGLEDEFYNDSDALILYTSGTTGSPKGVVLTHSNIHVQTTALVQAWEWSQKDIVLHALPLHHLHGIINVLLCPLVVGAKCVMLPKFESSHVWSHLLSINVPASERINMFMAVPTMYKMLIEEYDRIFTKNSRMQEYIKTVCQNKVRLMVSGSAPLPVPVFEKWEDITGHKLLERFGMTEVGMALSNPVRGVRKPGFVGTPLPNVNVRIAQFRPETPNSKYEIVAEGSEAGTKVTLGKEGEAGELLVKGPNVFRCYWNRPEATKKEFTDDGWFKSGDTAQFVDGAYKILGRTSVDIIKTGGYKVSALEVETHLLGHPDIADCSVIGLPDITWGQKVAAVVVPREGKEIILSRLREWAKPRMASYAVPTVLRCLDRLPKNNMGKVNKKELLKLVFPDQIKGHFKA